MSVEYWGIVGFGVCLDDIYKYINSQKVFKAVKNLFPDKTFDENILDDDTFYGDPYSNFAEFLCEFDSRKIMTYEDDGQGVAYFLYMPPYPWHAKQTEPKSINELKDYIISILRNVYDATYEQLNKYIEFINTVGCG